MPITITVDQRECDGGFQLSINKENPDGGGHGYRIAGPKYDSGGKTLVRHVLTKRDVDAIRAYLRDARK